MAAPMLKKLVCIKNITDSLTRSNSNAFSTTFILYNDPMKSKFMIKLMNKRKRNEKWVRAPWTKQSVTDHFGRKKPMTTGKSFSVGRMRRAQHVNKIFFEYISEIIGSGQLGIYVNVTRVETLADMSYVNVFWESNGTKETDNNTQELLQKQAARLRHILITLCAVGNVPEIVFVIDSSLSQQRQLEELLRRADMGPDVQLDVNGNIVPDVDDTEKLETFSKEFETNEMDISNEQYNPTVMDNVKDAQLPHDLYGLPQSQLMEKLIKAKLQAKKPVVPTLGDADPHLYAYAPKTNKIATQRRLEAKQKWKDFFDKKRREKKLTSRDVLNNTEFEEVEYLDDPGTVYYEVDSDDLVDNYYSDVDEDIDKIVDDFPTK